MARAKSPKNAATVQAARHSLVDANVLLDRAVGILAGMDDAETLIEAVHGARRQLSKLNHRFEIEVKFLKWKETKQANGEWRQDEKEPA